MDEIGKMSILSFFRQWQLAMIYSTLRSGCMITVFCFKAVHVDELMRGYITDSDAYCRASEKGSTCRLKMLNTATFMYEMHSGR